MWEGKIRLLRRGINEANQNITLLGEMVSNSQADINKSFIEIRQQIAEVKNEQKKTDAGTKSTMDSMLEILKRLDQNQAEVDEERERSISYNFSTVDEIQDDEDDDD